ncbi:hypothetical protein Ancab_012484 [Ancistrocladus abbreviatus]
MHSEDDVLRFLKMVNEEGRLNCRARPSGCRLVLLSPTSTLKVLEEVDSLSSSFGRTTYKDKVNLSVDPGNTTVHHKPNSFIPDTTSRSQNGYLRPTLQATDGKAENEKPGTSAFSMCLALDISLSPNTKAAHPSHGKAGASRKCQTLHGPSSSYSLD